MMLRVGSRAATVFPASDLDAISHVETVDHCRSTMKEDANVDLGSSDTPAVAEEMEEVYEQRQTSRRQKNDECPYCGKCVAWDMAGHIRIHTGETPYKCSQCMQCFSRKKSLMVHFRRCHTNERPFACKYCPKSFVTSGTRTEHERSVHIAASAPLIFKCDGCDKSFPSKMRLRRHSASHKVDIKKYACDQCDRRCESMSVLRTHMVIHSDERPFACTHCPLRFKLEGTRYRHELSVHLWHNVRPFTCKVCGKAFKREITLKYHKQIHNPVMPYHCPQCTYASHHKAGLRSHLLHHHLDPAGADTTWEGFVESADGQGMEGEQSEDVPTGLAEQDTSSLQVEAVKPISRRNVDNLPSKTRVGRPRRSLASRSIESLPITESQNTSSSLRMEVKHEADLTDCNESGEIEEESIDDCEGNTKGMFPSGEEARESEAQSNTIVNSAVIDALDDDGSFDSIDYPFSETFMGVSESFQSNVLRARSAGRHQISTNQNPNANSRTASSVSHGISVKDAYALEASLVAGFFRGDPFQRLPAELRHRLGNALVHCLRTRVAAFPSRPLASERKSESRKRSTELKLDVDEHMKIVRKYSKGISNSTKKMEDSTGAAMSTDKNLNDDVEFDDDENVVNVPVSIVTPARRGRPTGGRGRGKKVARRIS